MKSSENVFFFSFSGTRVGRSADNGRAAGTGVQRDCNKAAGAAAASAASAASASAASPAVDGKVVICSLNGRQPLLRARSISADTHRRGPEGRARTAGSRHLDFTPLFCDDKIQDVGGGNRLSSSTNPPPTSPPTVHGFHVHGTRIIHTRKGARGAYYKYLNSNLRGRQRKTGRERERGKKK